MPKPIRFVRLACRPMARSPPFRWTPQTWPKQIYRVRVADPSERLTCAGTDTQRPIQLKINNKNKNLMILIKWRKLPRIFRAKIGPQTGPTFHRKRRRPDRRPSMLHISQTNTLTASGIRFEPTPNRSESMPPCNPRKTIPTTYFDPWPTNCTVGHTAKFIYFHFNFIFFFYENQ